MQFSPDSYRFHLSLSNVFCALEAVGDVGQLLAYQQILHAQKSSSK
jgi:hypothetical protein